MRRTLATLAVLALGGLTLVLLLGGRSDTETARRSVPFGFFGTVFNVPAGISDPVVDRQFLLMARSGVESVRVPVLWGAVEPARGVYDWTASDRLVAAAARHRIQILANVLRTPAWASERPTAADPGIWPPRDPVWFAAFMRRLVQRYGPRGTFWERNRSVPRVPVRWWQVWNEPMGLVHWAKRPWAPSFTRILRAGYTAVHRADRGAHVVAASLATFNRYTSWDGARDLYRAGARRSFDVVSVHPFTNGSIPVAQSVDRVVATVQRVRQVMRRRGDGRKPIILTEVSWPAALGHVPRDRLLGLETTSRGQEQRLRAAYARLVRERRRLGIAQVYWFTWASEYDANSPAADVAYRFSGLTRLADGAFTPLPILRAYSSMAATYEGCRKGETATSCG
jgi:Beta-galactosidase